MDVPAFNALNASFGKLDKFATAWCQNYRPLFECHLGCDKQQHKIVTETGGLLKVFRLIAKVLPGQTLASNLEGNAPQALVSAGRTAQEMCAQFSSLHDLVKAVVGEPSDGDAGQTTLAMMDLDCVSSEEARRRCR